MNPERLSRDAVRLVDRLEAEQVRRIQGLLDDVYRDARARLSALDLADDSVRRAIREVQIRRVLEGSDAARQLLSLGRQGPLADAMRADIQQAYREGLRTAGEAIEARTQATAGQISAAAAFGARVDLDLIRAITESTLTTLDRVGREAMMRLERAIVRVAVRGSGPRAGARAVREAVDVTRVEAERITRTVLQRANSEARMDGYRAANVEHVQYDATNDSRTCPYCAARHGMVYEIERAPSLPLHPNCLVGNTHVLAEGVTGYSKRWYEGPVVTIATSMGDRLTVTPNHPILTPSGWVPAGRLNVGGHVVTHRARQRPLTARLDDQNVEGAVEQVVDALAESPEMAARPVPVSTEHFHGDGLGSEVAVVGADRELWDRHDATVAEKVMQPLLVGASELALRLDRLGLAHQGAHRDALAAAGSVCLAHLPLALRFGHAGPLDALGFRLIAPRDSELVEPTVDDVAADAVSLGEAVDALPAGVAVAEVVEIEWDVVAAHVYNLETRRGWYVADGILTHNCRCVLLPWRADASPEDRADAYYTRTRRDLREREEITTRETGGRRTSSTRPAESTTATAAAPFERADGEEAPRPVWAPGRGWL